MGSGFRDFLLDIPAGVIAGVLGENKFGRNPDVDTAADEDIWDGGGFHVPPTDARIHDIASTDGNDDGSPLGTGARTILIKGLDSSWLLKEETIILNGTTNVPTANAYRRIFRMYILTVGTGGANVGTITATAQVDATVTAQINPGNNQTLMAVYTVPAGMTAYMTYYYGSLNRASALPAIANIGLYIKEGADQADNPLRIRHILGIATTGNNPFRHPFVPYLKIPEKSDIVLRAADASQNDSDVSGGFDLFLVDN